MLLPDPAVTWLTPHADYPTPDAEYLQRCCCHVLLPLPLPAGWILTLPEGYLSVLQELEGDPGLLPVQQQQYHTLPTAGNTCDTP